MFDPRYPEVSGRGKVLAVEKWHPIMAAIEDPTGVWRMVDPQGVEYGRVELRRVNAGKDARYKALYGPDVIGWSTSLRMACERVHRAHIAAHGPNGRPMADWGGVGWRGGRDRESVPSRLETRQRSQ